MKKIYKVLIAFVVIVAIATATYFALNNNNRNQALFNLMNEYNSKVVIDEKNVVKEVDVAIKDMLTIINQNNLEMEKEKAFLQAMSDEVDTYKIVKEKVLAFGEIVNENDNGEIISEYEKSYKRVVGLYKAGYKYLLDTYYKIKDSGYEHIGTMKTYIENFVVVLDNANSQLNSFYYNAGLIFAYGTKNISDINNQVKLQVAYYVELCNAYFNADEETDVAKIKQAITSMEHKIETANLNNYLNNKAKIDGFMVNAKSLDLSNIAKQYSTLKEEYINSIEDEQVRANIQSFVDLIVEV